MLSCIPGNSSTVPRAFPEFQGGKVAMERYLVEPFKSGPWTGISGASTFEIGAGVVKTVSNGNEDTQSVAATQGSARDS